MNTNEGKMWNMIGACGWVESGHDYSQIENFLISNYTNEEIVALDSFTDERVCELMNHIDTLEEVTGNRFGNYGGDDSYNDLISHVVGMGKLTFDTIMAHPSRLNEIDYVENFRYSIPNDPEYARTERTLGFHQEQAANCMKELERITLENSPDKLEQDVILELTARMVHLSQGNLIEACEGLTKYKSEEWNRVYRRFYQWPTEGKASGRPGASYGEANDKMAMFANCLSDAAQKLIN